jgi:GNAT superfamily N-acetyltransferase
VPTGLASLLEVSESDPAAQLLIATAMGPDGDLVEARLARGCRCFGVWRDGELAGYGWLSTQPEWIGELELEIKPGPGEAYIWNCFTLAHHRRRGVLRALLAGIRARAQSDGMNRIWIGSVAIPAERTFGPSGFNPALAMTSTTIAGFNWLQVRPAPGADPALVTAAHEVVATNPGWHLRRSKRRRH